MWPFGKKKIIEKKIGEALKIQVIPDDFYGGKDPVIHYHEAGQNAPVRKEANQGKSLLAMLENKKIVYILIAIFLIIFTAIASWYYVDQASKSTTNQIAPVNSGQQTTTPTTSPNAFTTPTTTVEPVLNQVITSTLQSPTSTAIPSTATSSVKMLPLQFPETNFIDSQDSDNDSLTDAEEAVFNTNPNKWDTDGDGYYDGLEVVNLYNPNGLAPVKIIDSGLVTEYANPTWQYRLYYPNVWIPGNVDPQGNQVLFSAASGDFISVESYKKNAGESFADWFAREAAGQKFGDLINFKNKFQVDGYKRKDDLVAYFVDGDNVFVLIYHPGSQQVISFRHIMQMVVNSFRPGKTSAAIPDQAVLPPVPDFSSTSSIKNNVSSSTP